MHPKINIPRQRGLSLVELMISLTIGLLLLTGLSLLFVESSRSHRELSEASKQIENGRYAIQLFGDDLHLAGFYGRFTSLPATPAAADPCATGDTANLYNALPIHIQGYRAANFTTRPAVSALCAAYLPDANLQPGSDVFAIRRAGTSVLVNTNAAPPVLTATTTANEVYIQANVTAAEIQKGGGGVIDKTMKADGTAATLLQKLPFGSPGPADAAEIRKYNVHVYFVAPCSMPADGTNTCTGSADDGGKPIPTLKRLELTSVSGATTMNIVSLVEGIEMLKVDYGWDSDNDGSPNDPSVATAPTFADWVNIMGVNIYLVARNPLITANYTDTKTYAMGLAGNYAPGGSHKRHVYSTSVRLTNPGMRREQ